MITLKKKFQLIYMQAILYLMDNKRARARLVTLKRISRVHSVNNPKNKMRTMIQISRSDEQLEVRPTT